MSDPQQVRPEVVDTIFAVLKGADPAELPASATREEKDAAKDRYLSEFVAERSKRDRQTRAWELLLTRSYEEPPTWQRLFDDLSDDVVEELGELYNVLPAGAQEEYARRYGVPTGVCPRLRCRRGTGGTNGERTRPRRGRAVPPARAHRRGRHGRQVAVKQVLP